MKSLVLLFAALPAFGQHFQCIGAPVSSGGITIQLACASERNGAITWNVLTTTAAKAPDHIEVRVKYSDFTGTEQTEHWYGPIAAKGPTASRPFQVPLERVTHILVVVRPKAIASADFH